MNPEVLKLHLMKNNLNANKLAKLMSLSRETVSRWLRDPKKINLKLEQLMQLSQIFKTNINHLVADYNDIDENNLKKFETILNWDRKHASLKDFIIATLNWDYSAIARLVQVKGFFTSAKLLQLKNIKPLLDRYPYYKKFIHPKKRELLDRSYLYLCNQI
jgi:transcriptional regulator with XRE-family HTH domain